MQCLDEISLQVYKLRFHKDRHERPSQVETARIIHFNTGVDIAEDEVRTIENKIFDEIVKLSRI